MTEFEKKKENIKQEARQTKFSVWYLDTNQKPEIEKQDQTNGELYTAVENMILKYYAERQLLNGQYITKTMGYWNNNSSNSPWTLSVEASDFDTFPTVSKQYMDMNVYKLSEYVYKNGTIGNGNEGIIGNIEEALNIIESLLNGKVFKQAGNGPNKWTSPSGTKIHLHLGFMWIDIPGQTTEPLIKTGDYYFETSNTKWFGTLKPRIVNAGNKKVWAGNYEYITKHAEPSDFDDPNSPHYLGSPTPATVQNYYQWSNAQRTSNGDWWSSNWDEFTDLLQSYIDILQILKSSFNAILPFLNDEINYYKAQSIIGGSSEPNWQLLGGTGTWDNPGDIAFGWNETNTFKTEVENGGGQGSWPSQLDPYIPSSPTPSNYYSDTNLNNAKAVILDKKNKISSRINQINNDILGVLNPENKDGSFSALRSLRYLWIDARLNKSNGTLVQKKSTYSGINILTKKAQQLNNQLDVLKIPYDQREPRVIEVDASKMEFDDRIIVSWKMVVQATQYSIYRFDGGSEREYNAPDGPEDALFALIATIDAVDEDNLPVTKYTDTNVEKEHFYYYKVRVHHDGSGFPPPYDLQKKSTHPEHPTASLLSLNVYEDKVWRAIINGQVQLLPGFINSGAVRS